MSSKKTLIRVIRASSENLCKELGKESIMD